MGYFVNSPMAIIATLLLSCLLGFRRDSRVNAPHAAKPAAEAMVRAEGPVNGSMDVVSDEGPVNGAPV